MAAAAWMQQLQFCFFVFSERDNISSVKEEVRMARVQLNIVVHGWWHDLVTCASCINCPRRTKRLQWQEMCNVCTAGFVSLNSAVSSIVWFAVKMWFAVFELVSTCEKTWLTAAAWRWLQLVPTSVAADIHFFFSGYQLFQNQREKIWGWNWLHTVDGVRVRCWFPPQCWSLLIRVRGNSPVRWSLLEVMRLVSVRRWSPLVTVWENVLERWSWRG